MFCFFPARSLDKLYNFADCSGLHLIFALNALRRNPNNSWNSSNALSLLKYSASKKYNISWELGNGGCGNGEPRGAAPRSRALLPLEGVLEGPGTLGQLVQRDLEVPAIRQCSARTDLVCVRTSAGSLGQLV